MMICDKLLKRNKVLWKSDVYTEATTHEHEGEGMLITSNLIF